jgi:hypothetical protein
MARSPGLNPNFDNFTSSTISNYVNKKYRSMWAQKDPLIFRIMQAGNAKPNHGNKYVLQFSYPSPVINKPTGISDGFQAIPMPTQTGGFSAFEFTPAYFAMHCGIEKYEVKAQGGSTQLIDIVQATLDQNMNSWIQFYRRQFWAAEATAGSNGSQRNVLVSLRTMFNGGGTNTTGGGGDPAPKAPQLTAAVGTTPLTLFGGVERNAPGGAYQCPNLFVPTTNFTPSATLLFRLYNSTMVEGANGSCDLMFMPENLYTYFDTIIASQQRWTGESQMAKLGFNAFRLKGCEVVFDDYVPSSVNLGVANSNQIFAINTESLRLFYDEEKPVFKKNPLPDRPGLENYTADHLLQLCTDDTGRRHSRMINISDVS